MGYGAGRWCVVRHEFENASWGRWYYPRNGNPTFYRTEAEAESVATALNAERSEAAQVVR